MSTEAEWLAWRAAGWGASDIAAAWCNRYGGAYRVVARKAGLLDEVEATRETDRGHELEAALYATTELLTRRYVIGRQARCEHDPDPRWRCTADGFLAMQPQRRLDYAMPDELEASLGPVELKTHGVNVTPAWDYYEAQVQWQLMVTDFRRGLLVLATVDDDDEGGDIVAVRRRWVDADPLVQASLVHLAEQLDEHVRAGTLPDPDGSDLATAAVRAVTWVAQPDDHAVDLAELELQVERLDELRERIADDRTEATAIENVLKARIGTSARGVAGEWVVSYGKARRVLDEQLVLDRYPELAKAVLDREAAEVKLGKDGLDAFREAKGARALTIHRTKERAT